MDTLSWLIFLSLFFYLIPIIRLSSKPLRALIALLKTPEDFRFSGRLIRLGRWEYLTGPFRDRLLSVIFLGFGIYIGLSHTPLRREDLASLALIVFYNLLAVITLRYRDGVRLKMAELARCRSEVHPEDFFHLFYMSLSPFPPRLPIAQLRSIDFRGVDYRSEKPVKRSFAPILEASLSTSTLARMAILAFKRVGPEYGRDAFDGLARLWGSRLAQIFQLRLCVTGAEAIPPLEGKTLLLFNHKSYLDFALNFFALAMLRKSDGRHLRPRFIAAKDHFVDNPIIHSWMGLGKAIEDAGMIFINRKKGKGWAAMAEAAELLVNSEVEIAVYPQGTRAYFMQSPAGERLDAGYYTTFGKRNWDQALGHLKPGTAHLIVDTLMALRQRGETKLNVLVTGIVGTAIAGPKGSFKIQNQAEVEFRIAELWVLSTQQVEGIERPAGAEAKNREQQLYVECVQQIQGEINHRLLQALNWHQTLIDRLQHELARLETPPQEAAELLRKMRQAEAQNEPRPFILIDRIFSLPPHLWERFLRLFTSLREKDFEDGAWRALLEEVSERLKIRQR